MPDIGRVEGLMAIYLFTGLSPKPVTISALQARYADHFRVSDAVLAFRAPTPTNAKDILLGATIPEIERGGIIISQITGDYWGYHTKPFWDWLEAAFRSDLG